MAELKDFMISRVRVKLFKIFFGNTQEMYYVRQLTRDTAEEINAVRRELNHMEKTGIIKSEKRGNRLYYFVNPSYDYFEEILSLTVKSTGLGQHLRDNRKKLGKVKYAMLSGAFVHRRNRNSNDVDLLVVGDVVLPELSVLVQQEEAARQTEINYTIMTEEEFSFRKNRRDPFLLNILSKTRFMLIGDEEGLVDKVSTENEMETAQS